MTFSLRQLLLCLVTFAGFACSTAMEWREVDVGAVPFEDCWTAVSEICQVDGFAIDHAAADRGRRLFVSKWLSRELAFGRGYRKRVQAEFIQDETTKRWNIRLGCEQQKVTDFGKELNPADQDWEANGQDPEIETRLLAKLAMRFRGQLAVPATTR